MKTPSKALILSALRAFILQRPRFNFANYGDASSYRADSRRTTIQRADALILLRAVEWRDSTTAEAIAAQLTGSGRLSMVIKGDSVALDYCAGQYYATEYRAAACRALAWVLWGHVRAHAMPAPTVRADGELRYEGLSAGDWLRRYFRREFGRGIASRYFN